MTHYDITGYDVVYKAFMHDSIHQKRFIMPARKLISVLLSTVLLHIADSAPLGLTRIEETYVLAGQSPPPSTVISCVIYSGVSASTIKWHHNGQDITIDNQKYQLLSVTRLRVNEITGADEGTYSCSFMYAGTRINTDLNCIFVLGAAEFASKATRTEDAFQGESVNLDTRVLYSGAGPSNSNQVITLLQLFKQDSTNGMKLVYFCNNEGNQKDSVCPSNDKVTATQGSHKFDLTLTLSNLSMEDGGEYLARVEVLHPGVSSRSYITKNFIINVHEPIQLIVRQEDNSLQCEASTTGADLSLLSLEWTDSEGQLLSSNENFRLTSANTGDKISLTAAYDTLSKEIEGQYFCTTSLKLGGTSGINKTVNTFLFTSAGNSSIIGDNGGKFQLAIGPVSTAECSLWYDREASSKMEATVRDGITIKVAEHCNCTVQPSDFSVGQLHCAGKWLYVKSSVQDAENEVILSAINDWLDSATPTITLGVFSLKVNSSCSTARKTLSLSNC